MTDQTQTQDPTSQVVPQVSVQQVPPVPVQSVPVQSVQQSVPVQPVAQLQPEAEAQPVQQPVPVQPVQPTQPVQQPVPQQVPVQPAPQPAPAETQGFWQTLRGGLKNLGQKAVPMLMDTAGKTLQTSAQAVGGVAQTTVNSGANLVQGIGSAVQDNQEGNFIQNVGGSIKDTASTIIQSGGQEVNGVVKVGKEAVANLSQQVPAQL
jgi:outer membrane biosynthesis protein TonB